jgi:hypothetical protein
VSRSTWAWVLIISNALSMAMMYAMQGILVAGIEHGSLPAWFWPADIVGWMLRSLVESLVVFYLFRTQTRNNLYKLLLIFFEISLISLIMLTQGPALYAMTLQIPVSQTMSINALRLWTAGLGTYGALMLAAAGTAYRIQPEDEEIFTATQCQEMLASQYQEYESEKANLEQQVQDELERGDELHRRLNHWINNLSGKDLTDVEQLAEVVGFVSEIEPSKFAKLVGLTVPQVYPALARGAELRKGESNK